MNIVQYIIANQGAGMSCGKLAAQVAHASCGAYTKLGHDDLDTLDEQVRIRAKWWETGHTKIVLAARDNEHMYAAERYLNDRGIQTLLIIDEGRTEIPSLTPTALGCELVDKDDEQIQFIFSTFVLYKDKPRDVIVYNRDVSSQRPTPFVKRFLAKVTSGGLG